MPADEHAERAAAEDDRDGTDHQGLVEVLQDVAAPLEPIGSAVAASTSVSAPPVWPTWTRPTASPIWMP
ncbi:hypothetical protein AB0L74_28850, partial [Streptomyces sp. NPDC052020]|uniref:hypothetical protein n=1 Tax=Streptomyces sp. NPDC052020 TaxID=3155677 RepID=UPI00343DA66E